METSTPVSKLRSQFSDTDWRKKAFANDYERTSNIPSSSSYFKSSVEDNELVYSQQPDETLLNKSEELFPISPIPFRKEVPSTLLPLLDTPDTKWTSSILTSFQAQSGNASPEVLSEDNFVRTVYIDSHVENNGRYTTSSNFTSNVPDFSYEINIKNELPANSYTVKMTSRPSSPILSTRRKEKKLSSINKELFPFPETVDVCRRQQSPPLDCGVMSDVTLNALEQICIDSEIMYSENSPKKEGGPSSADKDESNRNLNSSVDLSENSKVLCKDRRNFVYPYDNVKKPREPLRVNDIFQKVLSLETNEVSTAIPTKSRLFHQGLMCFNELELSFSQVSEPVICFLPSEAWNETEFESDHKVSATNTVDEVTYLPTFFRSPEQMSSTSRDVLTALKKYFECYRIHFAELISDCRRKVRQESSSAFIECIQTKFLNLSSSTDLINSFFDFFRLNPFLIYNFNLSRRFHVIPDSVGRAKFADYWYGLQHFRKKQFCRDTLPQTLPPYGRYSLETRTFLRKLIRTSDNVTGNGCLVPSSDIHCYQKTVEKKDYVKLCVPGSAAFSSSTAQIKPAIQLPPFCDKLEKNVVYDQRNDGDDCACEQMSFERSSLPDPKRLMQQLSAAFNSVSGKCIRIDDDLIIRAKKLLEDVTSIQKSASEDQYFGRSTEVSKVVNFSESKSSISISEKSVPSKNSAAIISRTPFDDDLDSADLMFICDLSEKVILPGESSNLPGSHPFEKNVDVADKLSQEDCKSLGTLTTCMPDEPECLEIVQNNCTSTTELKLTSTLRPSFKKCASEPFVGKSENISRKSLMHFQKALQDDDENWNPDFTTSTVPAKMKENKPLTRLTENRSPSFPNQPSFDGFNTASGRRINVQPNSLIRAKTLMDAIQVGPQMVDQQFLNRESFRNVPLSKSVSEEINSSLHCQQRCVDITVDKMIGVDVKSIGNGEEFKSEMKNMTSNDVDSNLLSQFVINKNTNFGNPDGDSTWKTKLMSDKSLKSIQELKNTDISLLQLPSFSTASGKEMNVSEKSLKKAKKMYDLTAEDSSFDKKKLNEDEINASLKSPIYNSNRGEKMIKTDNSLAYAQKSHNSSIFEKPFVHPLETKKFGVAECHQFSGFCSAAGKMKIVNEDSLRRAKQIYQSTVNPVFTESARDRDEQFPCFSSASGKTIRVAENSLQKARKFYESVSNEQSLCNSESTITNEDLQKHPQLASFKTVGSTKLYVSEESSRKAEKLHEPSTEYCGRELKTVETDSDRLLQFSSLCSASGKKIHVAEKSMQQAKKLCESVSKEMSSWFVEANQSDQNVPREFASFSSVLVKNLPMKGTSVGNVEKLFAPCAVELVESVELNKSEPQQFPIFSSASGKKIRVSGDSVQKAHKLYDSSAEITFASKIDKSVESSSNLPHRFCAFSSVSGKRINVSEKSLKNARNLYESVSMDPPDCLTKSFIPDSTLTQQLASFSTASGKKIRVTEEALKNSKKLYNSVSKDIIEGIKTDILDQKLPRPSDSFASSAFCQKSSVINESLQSAENLFKLCSNEGANKARQDLYQDFSTSSLAAGKKSNAAEKKLLNTKTIFQSVSDESLLNLENIENLSDDFLTQHSTKEEQSFSSFNSNDATILDSVLSHSHSKRSVSDDFLQGVISSSTVSKKMKMERSTSKSIQKFGPLEKNVKIITSKSELVSSAKTVAKKANVVTSVCEQCGDLFSDSFSTGSTENNTLQKSQLQEKNLDRALSQTSEPFCDNIDASKLCGSSDYQNSFNDLDMAKQHLFLLEKNSTNEVISPEDTILLNLSQEISESTYAFLSDMKNENYSFTPVHSSPCFIATDDPESEIVVAETSRPSSPVFDSSKPGRKKTNKKRRSQHSLSLNPLDITYVRKDSEIASINKSSPEEVLKMFNENFAQKVNKRKEPASILPYPLSKKPKDSNEFVNVIEQRKRVAIEQQKLVDNKDKQLCKPRVGSILAEKLRGNRKSLREVVDYEQPRQYSVSKLLQLGLKRSVVNVNADNAHEFIFTADFLSAEKVRYGDGCIVVANEKNEVYFDDLARAFLASPGVDPRLISLPWIRNHYRWIIWKLASTEKRFPTVFGGKYLTLDNVLRQLKFRYDWEVDRCQRSALKRILECDSSPSEAMILCVASIKTIVASLNEYEIEMTDGWYSISCSFDGEMLKLLTQKKITIGTKLMIMNAELTGAGEGCDPLQPNQNVRLKIATNSVRRARWYASLGFYAGKSIVVSDLQTILPNGGVVPQFSAVIARLYPMLYLNKKEDGSCALYNEKVHFKKMADFEKRRQICLESLLSQVSSEVQDENLSVVSDEYRNANSDSDPVSCQNRQYHEQERLQILIQERLQQKLPEEFKTTKRTSSMLKVRLINKDIDNVSSSAALLTIWHPPEDLVSLLSEGKLYEFHKVAASGYRNGQIQLSANRMTKYKHLSVCDTLSHSRRVTAFCELNADFTAVFGEVDIVGLVINVGEISSELKNDRSQTVYLADLEKNLMVVKFQTNVKDLGFEDTLKLKNVIAGLNLQWKRVLYNKQIPIVFASELTSFVYKSRCEHLQNCIDRFDRFFKNQCIDDFVAECNEKLNDILTSSGPVATSTPVRPNKRPSLANENSTTSEPFNDSSPQQNNSLDCVDDNMRIKSKNVRSRIEKLRGYGEPPPLSPLTMNARPKGLRRSIQTRVHKLSINKC